MQIRHVVALPLTLVLAVAACRGREPAPAPHAPRASVLKDIPPAAYSVLKDTTGTSEAEQWAFTTTLPFDTAAAFYRRMLPELGWQVMSDRPDVSAGTIDLMAKQRVKTVWIHLERAADGSTRYTLIGAVDSAATRGIPIPRAGAR